MASANENEIHLDTALYRARILEDAERFEELAELMKGLAIANKKLGLEERNFLSVGYKNIIGIRRNSWRIMNSLEKHERQPFIIDVIRSCRKKVEDEISAICAGILEVIDKHLLPNSVTPDSTIFYHKLQGDYYRYQAEVKNDADRKEAETLSLKWYQTAFNKAKDELSTTHPVRLGVSLNFSVFYFEILKLPETACRMAKEAFDNAINDLEMMTEEHYNDSPAILELLKDNLARWISQMPEEKGDLFKNKTYYTEEEKTKPIFLIGSMVLPVVLFIVTMPNKSGLLSGFWK